MKLNTHTGEVDPSSQLLISGWPVNKDILIRWSGQAQGNRNRVLYDEATC